MTNCGKYVFLDRDGTLIENKHYLRDPDGVEFCDQAIEGLKNFKNHGYRFVVVTNQSGIGRGLFGLEDMHRVHQRITELLEEHDLFIDEFLFCPHHPDDECNCRKPKAGMYDEWVQRCEISMQDSIMIGDNVCDIEFGKNIGGRTVLIAEGEQSIEEVKDCQPDFVVRNLKEAAILLLA